MKDFFISYNRADRAWAVWIAWELEAVGYTTVVQAWDFRPGSNFLLEMQKASSDTERTMPVLSPDYLAAEYTQPEWAAALAADPGGEKQKLVPIRVRECTPPGLLRPIVYIDLVGLAEVDCRSVLIDGVHRERIKPSAQPCFPGAAPVFPGPSQSRHAVGPSRSRHAALMLVASSLALAALVVTRVRGKHENRLDPVPRTGYVSIPPGEFLMGCSAEEPPCHEDEMLHRVRLPDDFYLKQTEVTVREFRRYAADARAPMPRTDDAEVPVTGITWEQASAYCKWAGGRLPTEAEWEYAARAKTLQRFYGRLDDIAWYQGNTPLSAPQKVGQKLRNEFEMYDMIGNVAEWVNDWYSSEYYKVSRSANPEGPASGTERVVRGGSFLDGPDSLRVSRRDRKPPYATANHVGFRCVQKPTRSSVRHSYRIASR